MAKKTVLALMRRHDMVCLVRRRRRYSSYGGEVGKVAANLLNRDFTSTAPNQKWVTDVTEFRVGEHKLYLSPVMDLFDRQIIAYRTGTSPTLELTHGSLRDALHTALGAAPLVHSDQGIHPSPVLRSLLQPGACSRCRGRATATTARSSRTSSAICSRVFTQPVSTASPRSTPRSTTTSPGGTPTAPRHDSRA